MGLVFMDERYPIRIEYKGSESSPNPVHSGSLDAELTQASWLDLVTIIDRMVAGYSPTLVPPRVYHVTSRHDVDPEWVDTVTKKAVLSGDDLTTIMEWVADRAAVEDEREAESEGQQP
jgi:hypothetical protein